MASVPFDVASELRLVPGLDRIDVETLSQLAAHANHRGAHGNVTLLAQGGISPHFLFLVRGVVKLVHQTVDAGDANPVVLGVARAPCRVPDPSAFDEQPSQASIITLRSSQYVTIPRAAMFEALGRAPELARFLLEGAAADARGFVQRIDELVTGTADERIIRLLDGLARTHGTPLGQGRFIAIPLRRRDIAHMINATTETVSRLLARLERDGRARSTRDGIWWVSPRASIETLASPAQPQHFPTAKRT